MNPGDAYNQFITRVKEDASNSYAKPNDIEVKSFNTALIIPFKSKDGNGYVKIYPSGGE